MNTYLCDDGNNEIEIQAESAREAAEQYVDGGDYGDDWGESESHTSWVEVYVQQVDSDGEEIGDRESHTIEIDPEEPDCSHDDGHDWQSPYEVLGGLKENPGVWGKGGGVVVTKVCAHCGQYKITDSWAQNPGTGEQGLHSVEYREADDESLAWVDDRVDQILRAADDDDLRDAAVSVIGLDARDIARDADGDLIYGDGAFVALDFQRRQIAEALA